MPPVAALVNSSFDAANVNLSEVQQAHQDSEQLLDDVTEAEGIPLIYMLLSFVTHFKHSCLSSSSYPLFRSSRNAAVLDGEVERTVV